MNQYFPNDQYMRLQSHKRWVKGPFKLQKRPVNFNETEFKMFIDMVSDFTLQRTLKNYHLVSLGSVNKEYPRLSKKGF